MGKRRHPGLPKKGTACQSTMEHWYRLPPSRCGGNEWQKHQSIYHSSTPAAAEAEGNRLFAAACCNFSFGLGKEVICCSVQLLNHLSLKPAVSPIVALESTSPVHGHTEAHLDSWCLKVSASNFCIHFKAGPHCQMFSKWLWSKLSLGLIKTIYAVSHLAKLMFMGIY